MGLFLKGNQQQFVFSKADARQLAQIILADNYVIYEEYVDDRREKFPIDSMERFLQTTQKRIYTRYSRGPDLSVVRKDIVPLVTWEKINLHSGGVRYRMHSLEAHAVQLLLSDQNRKRIGTGRISLSTEWLSDDGNIVKEEISVEIYKSMKKYLRKLSAGKVFNIFVGKDAYKKWSAGKIELAYGLDDREVYKLDDFKAF